MARIVGGIGASHTPTIGFAIDTHKRADPAWTPIFEGFDAVRRWLDAQRIDVLFATYNDHVTSFFFDHYSMFVLGVDDEYRPADEGGGPRDVAAIAGHADLARHIAASLVADEFDLSFFQGKPADHGLLSPMSALADDGGPWPGRVVPLQVGVLQVPGPSAARCYKLGRALRRAIVSYPDPDLRVAVMATGGLSHQVHGERAGFLDEEWDGEFLDLIETDPERLAKMRLAEYATRGGFEGAEVVTWLIMRGALSDRVRRVHRHTYAPSMTDIATAVWEDLGDEPSPVELAAHRERIGAETAGIERLAGTYPFTLERSRAAFRVNDFLHRLVEPAHRERFVTDFDALASEFDLSDVERRLIADRDWIGMIHYGVIFFLLEKMAAVLGVSNPQVYAAFRGQSLEEFLATRRVGIQYSVAGGPAAQAIGRVEDGNAAHDEDEDEAAAKEAQD